MVCLITCGASDETGDPLVLVSAGVSSWVSAIRGVFFKSGVNGLPKIKESLGLGKMGMGNVESGMREWGDGEWGNGRMGIGNGN